MLDKKDEKLQKLEYLKSQRSVLDEIKNIIHDFLRASLQ